MPTPEKKRKDLLKLAEAGGTDKELALLDKIHDLEDKFDETVSKIKESVPDLVDLLKDVRGRDGEDGESIVGPKGDKGDRGERGPEGKQGPQGIPGKEGKTPLPGELKALIEPLIPQVVAIDEIALANSIQADIESKLPALGKAVRDALELLNGDDRLDITALRGIEELKNLIDGAVQKAGVKSGWGAHPLTIQQSGTTKAKVARVINFTGATVSINASGVITVAITGGTGYTKETPTGTINGSNKTFTVTSTPVYIVVDGATYFENDGYTIVGTTVTTVVAPTGFIRSFF